MRFVAACVVLSACLWIAQAAHAQASESPDVAAEKAGDSASQSPRSSVELSLIGHVGGFIRRADDDAVTLGGSGLARSGLLEAGVQLDLVSPLFDTSVFAPALIAGIGWQSELGLRLDLLGVLGADFYDSHGAFLGNDPGASATLGFGGARIGIGYRFGQRGNGHLYVGALGSYAQDFEHVTVHYSYTQSSWFGADDQPVNAQQTFGDRRLGLALCLGLTFDV